MKLSCPFCGSPGGPVPDSGEENPYWWASCSRTNCVILGPYESAEQAGVVWNTRFLPCPPLTDAERFYAGLAYLTQYPGWQRYYLIRAESTGKARGYWYYHTYPTPGFYEMEFAAHTRLKDAGREVGIAYRPYQPGCGHYEVGQVAPAELEGDITAGLVRIARQPRPEGSTAHAENFPFAYFN